MDVDITPAPTTSSAADSQAIQDGAAGDSRSTTSSRHLFREKVFPHALSCNFCFGKVKTAYFILRP